MFYLGVSLGFFFIILFPVKFWHAVAGFVRTENSDAGHDEESLQHCVFLSFFPLFYSTWCIFYLLFFFCLSVCTLQ